MVSEKVRVNNPSGLHLRPAGILCKEAMKYKSLITFVLKIWVWIFVIFINKFFHKKPHTITSVRFFRKFIQFLIIIFQ